MRECLGIFPALLTCLSGAAGRGKSGAALHAEPDPAESYELGLETPSNPERLTVKQEFDVTSGLVRDGWCSQGVLPEDSLGI